VLIPTAFTIAIQYIAEERFDLLQVTRGLAKSAHTIDIHHWNPVHHQQELRFTSVEQNPSTKCPYQQHSPLRPTALLTRSLEILSRTKTQHQVLIPSTLNIGTSTLCKERLESCRLNQDPASNAHTISTHHRNIIRRQRDLRPNPVCIPRDPLSIK
jgi:hypothetical protein